MFSPRIIERKQSKLEEKLGISLHRYEIGEVEDRVEHLKTLVNEDNKLVRQLRPAELEFINNENLLSAIDFRYWAERYGTLKLSGGGMGCLKPWGSQEIVLNRCAKIEEREWEKKDRNEPFSGIRMLWHKARQLGLTAVARLIIQHGLYFNQHVGALSASIGQGEIGELYDRDSLIYDHLPWWMKPERRFNVKNESMHFEKLNTRIEYQESKQKSGLGIGRQFELSHLTECAAWENSAIIELDYFPTIPIVNRDDAAYKRGPRVIAILESTAQGRGNWWHEYTEATRIGDHPEWDYIFIPWYAEPGKYRLTPPPSWRPNEVTKAHAKRVEATSSQWMGQTVRLDVEQLYYYERGYESARKANTLNFFLTNYPAEPEEGFQHSTAGAFDFDSLDRFQRMCKEPEYFEFVRDDKGKLQRSPLLPDEMNMNDLRGILCVWENPKLSETYVVGVDPAGGIMNWDRRVRTSVDRDTDNAVCSVIRVGRRGQPDVQVAEYAAPLIIPDFAPLCDYLGRWYAGCDEAEAALLIPETHGVNTTIIPELLQRLQYPNVYLWKYLDGAAPKRSNHYGWQPTQESNKALFLKALDWLGKGRIQVRSRFLVEEFKDCTSDWITASLRAKWGRHDDRVRALFLAIWAAHDWSTISDYENWEHERVEAKPQKPWAMGVSAEEMEAAIADEFSNWMD